MMSTESDDRLEGEPALTIIAVHGNGGGGFRFDRVQPYIPAHVRFEAVTLPGFAATPTDPGLRSVHDYAEHLHSLVRTVLRNPDQALILLGTGIGGTFVLDYSQRHSSVIDGIILHAPVGARLKTRRFPALMKLPAVRTLGQQAIASPLLRPLWKRRLFMDHTAIPPETIERFFEEYRQCRVFGQMFDIITDDWYQSLKPSPVPAGLLWGERERVLSVHHLEDYKRLLPNHSVRIVPGWDHFPMIEQPEQYAREVVSLAHQLAAGQRDQRGER
jgi:pimeloyl-ACP methyl ester carboxylesterase